MGQANTRILRFVVKEEDIIYHVVSQPALPGVMLEDVEKDYLLNLLKRLRAVFFVDVIGFCIMGNHFHILVNIKRSENYCDSDV